MRNIYSAGLFAILLIGCNDAVTTTNELGLKISQLDDSHVSGRMTTTSGSVDFTAVEEIPGQFEIRFDRGQGQFGTSVDWNEQVADFAWPDGMKLSADDRFVLTALSLAVENELGKDTRVTDNLFRQSSLWGAHPAGDIKFKPIVGDATRGWTTLCSAGACNATAPSRSFSHSGSGSQNGNTCGSHAGTVKSFTRKFGKADTINPCNARCGASCAGVGTSTYTVDCGNHDTCEYWHTGDCGDEFTSASDDFTLAPNCSC